MTKPSGSKYAPDTDEENDAKPDSGYFYYGSNRTPIVRTLLGVILYFAFFFGLFDLIGKH